MKTYFLQMLQMGKIMIIDFNKEQDDFIEYKFDEDLYCEEIFEYIKSTYDSHYSKEKFQSTEFIIDGGHGTGFNVGNILKYAQRYGKKGSREDARKDLMKVIHYAIIQLYVHDTDEEMKDLEDFDA